MTILETAH